MVGQEQKNLIFCPETQKRSKLKSFERIFYPKIFIRWKARDDDDSKNIFSRFDKLKVGLVRREKMWNQTRALECKKSDFDRFFFKKKIGPLLASFSVILVFKYQQLTFCRWLDSNCIQKPDSLNTKTRVQLTANKFSPMARFKLQISGFGSDRSTTWTTVPFLDHFNARSKPRSPLINLIAKLTRFACDVKEEIYV